MDISVEQLLRKIEGELHKAKQEKSSSKIRESVHSIKILCELILEENEVVVSHNLLGLASPKTQVLSPPSLTTKKVEMDEEANGDSLFDF